jgi:LacI family transcriptional regulator
MYFHAEIITTIQNELHTHGYNLIICQSNDSVELEKELTRTLYASCVDAVIAACTLFTTSLSHFDVLTQNNVPVVFYDRVPVQPYPACMIKGDDFHGGRLAAEHLLAQGCRRIAYISGPLNCSLYIDRFAGFQKAMREQGVVLPDSRVFHHELSADNARRTMTSLFAQKPRPDAIFAGNDISALEVLRFADEHGASVPAGLKVMGYSNDPRSSIVTPSMTTIEQFPANIGKVVVAELLKLLRPAARAAASTATALFPQIVTPVELIARKSTCRPGLPEEP